MRKHCQRLRDVDVLDGNPLGDAQLYRRKVQDAFDAGGGERIGAGTRSYKDAIKKARQDFDEKKITKEELEKIVAEELREELRKEYKIKTKKNVLYAIDI